LGFIEHPNRYFGGYAPWGYPLWAMLCVMLPAGELRQKIREVYPPVKPLALLVLLNDALAATPRNKIVVNDLHLPVHFR